MFSNTAYSMLDEYKDEITKSLSSMIAIPAISPRSGGIGEGARADFLQKLLKGMGFAVRRYDYNDGAKANRSNLVVSYGNKKKTLWVIAHIDTVSEGDRSMWSHDPFKAFVDGSAIYGRGANDNGQDVIAGIYALKAAKESRLHLKYNLGLALVADEETGSRYGIQSLLKEGIFHKDDLFLVPDYGAEDGSAIEVAEKGILWLKLTFKGKQVHASTPDFGVNAFRYLVRFLNQADLMLHEKYATASQLFTPEGSTFEMTKHEKNVDSINIISGLEVAYMDCRVLPDYQLDQIIRDMEDLAASDEFKPVEIKIEIEAREDTAPPTPKNSEVVQRAIRAVRESIGVKPNVIGIGGGTCAAYLRNNGMDAVVWSKKPDIAHQPDEYALIGDIIADARVFLRMCV